MTETGFSLKDHLFNEEKVTYLATLLGMAIDDFDRTGFVSEVMAELPKLELKNRIAHITSVMAGHLSPDFSTAAKQLSSALPPPLDPNLNDNDFGDFILAPFGKYVEEHGLDDYDISMPLLREITKRFSMEGPIRPFIRRHPKRAMETLLSWARDDNYHVRRLVSEGTRPRLPWFGRLDIDATETIPLLDILHADETRYVTRSVANHVNDIAKSKAALAVETVARWKVEQSQHPEEMDWIARHAMRTLIKQGHSGALEMLGYSPTPDVKAEVQVHTTQLKPGETLDFTAVVDARSSEQLLVDYAIEFVKKNGERKPKVFKLKTLTVERGDLVTLPKRHKLHANATTYTLYPGSHGLTLLVNGNPIAMAEFEVTTA